MKARGTALTTLVALTPRLLLARRPYGLAAAFAPRRARPAAPRATTASARPPPPTTARAVLPDAACDASSFEAVASSSSSVVSLLEGSAGGILAMDQAAAEALAGPLFGASLLPYLAFLYLLDVDENDTPKGVTVGFATCLLFVFLTIPAAIASKVWYGVSLADSDWLHGSAESLLTVTNLVTVVAFRQALGYR